MSTSTGEYLFGQFAQRWLVYPVPDLPVRQDTYINQSVTALQLAI